MKIDIKPWEEASHLIKVVFNQSSYMPPNDRSVLEAVEEIDKLIVDYKIQGDVFPIADYIFHKWENRKTILLDFRNYINIDYICQFFCENLIPRIKRDPNCPFSYSLIMNFESFGLVLKAIKDSRNTLCIHPIASDLTRVYGILKQIISSNEGRSYVVLNGSDREMRSIEALITMINEIIEVSIRMYNLIDNTVSSLIEQSRP